jgi:uncharacterized membrane protein
VSTGLLEVEFWFFLNAVIVDFSPHIACVRDFLFYVAWFVGKFGVRKVLPHCVLNLNAVSSHTMLDTCLCF